MASHQNHVVAFTPITEQLWVTFLDCREYGRCVEDLVKVLWACNKNNINLHKCKELKPEYWLLNEKTSSGEHISQQCNKHEIRVMGFLSDRKAEVGSSKKIPPFSLCSFACRHLRQLYRAQHYQTPSHAFCHHISPYDPLLHGHAWPPQRT